MKPRYWVQYTLLLTACAGGAIALQNHKAAQKRTRPQCCQQGCPDQKKQQATPGKTDDPPSLDQIFWGSANNRYIVYAR